MTITPTAGSACRTYPTVAPDIAVEILSPGDDATEVAERRKFLLRWGVKVVIIADPVNRTVEAHEPGAVAARYSESDVLTSRTFPSLAFALREIFVELDERAEDRHRLRHPHSPL